MTADQILACDYINAEFPRYEKRLFEFVTFDNLISEAFSLNSIEEVLPNKLFTEIHLDKILNESGSRVKGYYVGLASGKNQILEEARKMGLNSNQINEAIEDFRNFIKHKLFEDALALGAPIASAASGFEAALAGGDHLAPSKGSKWTVLGTLKSIWNGLTEGGSVIGIIHLIIDIIGLVGDFIFPGVGVAADIINAIIYAIRGKWILALISLVAAIIVGAGDGLKLFKPAVSTAEPILIALTKKGGVDAAAAMAGKVANKGPVMRFLGLLASMVGTVVSKASTILGKFIQGVGKIFSIIPPLGRLVKPIFDGLGTVLTKFGDNMKLFADNFALMEKGAAKTAVKEIDDAIGAGSKFEISKNGKYVEITNAAGKKVEYPAGKVLNSYNMTHKLKGVPFTNVKDLIKYNNALGKSTVKQAFNKRFIAFLSTRFNKEAAENFSKRMPYFIGKQIYKLIWGSEWLDGQSDWSKAEVEGHGNGAFNDFVNRRIMEEKKKTGAAFVPSLMLDSSDQEAFDHITDYQNNYAQLTGKPTITHVVYDKADNSPDAKEFKSFFEKVASGEIKRGDAGDIVQTTTSTDIRDTGKQKNESRTVLSFSDFKKI
jgi:hypothetical protein